MTIDTIAWGCDSFKSWKVALRTDYFFSLLPGNVRKSFLRSVVHGYMNEMMMDPMGSDVSLLAYDPIPGSHPMGSNFS